MDLEPVRKLYEAADEVWIANGCGSPELFDRAMGKLHAMTSAVRSWLEKEEGKEKLSAEEASQGIEALRRAEERDRNPYWLRSGRHG